MSPRERLADLVLMSICFDQGLPIGHFSNAKRYPELAELRSSDIAEIQRPAWFTPPKRPLRARCVRLGHQL